MGTHQDTTDEDQCPFPGDTKYACPRQGPPTGNSPTALTKICAACRNQHKSKALEDFTKTIEKG